MSTYHAKARLENLTQSLKEQPLENKGRSEAVVRELQAIHSLLEHTPEPTYAQAAMLSATHACITLNTEWSITGFNDKAREWAKQYTEQQLEEGMNLAGLLHMLTPEDELQEATKAALKGKKQTCETPCGKHTTKWFGYTAVPLKNQEGTIIGVMVEIRDITPQVEAQNLLKEKQKQLQLILASIQYQILTMDNKGYITAYNAGSPNQEKGYYRDVLPQAFAEKLTHYTTKARETLKTQSFDYVVPYQTGKRWYNAVVSLRHDQSGNYAGYTILSCDISSKMQVQEKLKANQVLLRHIIDSAPIWIALFDKSERYIIANDKFREFTDFPVEKIQGSYIKDILPELLYKRHKPWIKQALQGKSITFQDDFKQPFILHSHGVYKPLRDEKGNVEQVLTIAMNNTHQVKAEQALKDSENRFLAIAEALPIPFIMTHPKKDAIRMANRLFLELFGYSHNELKAISTSSLFANPTERNTLYNEVMHKGYAGNIEVKALNKNGETFPVLANAHLIKDNGEDTIIAGVQDISEQKANQQQLKEAMKRTEEANKLKSEFLANLSHEIRTPMNIIMGFTEILKSRLENVTDYREYLDGIYKSSRNLLDLINDILDISKIEAGKIEIQEDDVELHKLLEDIEEFFQIKATQKNLKLLTEIDNRIPACLQIDQTRLRQVLVNLVGNGLKFTEKGHVKTRAELLRHESSSNRVDISIAVEDTGIGIQSEKQKRIFTPFTQLPGKQEDYQEGTGLGLAITKRLVEAMGGSIRVESTPGEGSVFYIRLNNLKPGKPKSRTMEEVSENIDFVENTVLIADDMKSSRKILSNYLRNTSLITLEAENGQELLNLLRHHPPAAVLLDIYMPDMSGYEVAQKIKETEEFRNIPVIGVTVSSKARKNPQHFDEILQKPVSRRHLLTVLSKYLPVHSSDTMQESSTSPVNLNIEVHLEKLEEEERQKAKAQINSFKQQHQRIKSHLGMHEAEELAKSLNKFANYYGLDALNTLAKNLIKAARKFDIENVLAINDQIEASWPKEN